MSERLTHISEYFRKIPAAFLVAIVLVLGLILFLPEDIAKILAVDEFRNMFRYFLGPAFLLSVSFCVARVFVFLRRGSVQRRALKGMQESLHSLTPEEKGYLVPYIRDQQNTVNVGMDDGIMAGLRAKNITFLATSMGSALKGFPFNLQPWARDYLSKHLELLDGYYGEPRTPEQKLFPSW